ncbi:MAG: recombinase family protein, partial [Rhodospirillales bacterium]
GLDQEFNSLHAQREACEAFIASQKHEGWEIIETAYDDGGYSGGNMERPALKRLLADIEDTVIDVVVVYKVDRLTRSLPDFAKMVEIFDARGISFVSVTQQFNTTTSMGRLTLNVLLTFAQFEREVTGERIRDKIAASRKKGMWMGGNVALGYDAVDRKLVVNSAEASTVRMIFRHYLESGSVRLLKAELAEKGIVSKKRINPSGRRTGGNPLSRGSLYQILQNRLYIGKAVHKGTAYPGEHDGIVDRDLWDRVQTTLAKNAERRKNGVMAKEPSLLSGLLFDGNGDRLSPSHTVKNGKRYRYYVSQAVLQRREREAGAITRIPAHEIETAVCGRILSLLADGGALADVLRLALDPLQREALTDVARGIPKAWQAAKPGRKRALLRKILVKVILNDDRIMLEASTDGIVGAFGALAGQPLLRSHETPRPEAFRLSAEIRIERCRGETRVVVPNGTAQDDRKRPNAALIKAVARAHHWRGQLFSREAISMRTIAERAHVSDRYVRRILFLAFLAPDIVDAILDGRQPDGLTVDR